MARMSHDRAIRQSLVLLLVIAALLLAACEKNTRQFESSLNTLVYGDNFVVFAKPDGTVWAWGVNADGQLGNGTTQAVAEPIQVGGLKDIVGISSVFSTKVLALQSDGSLWAWGQGHANSLVPVRLIHVPALIDVQTVWGGKTVGVTTSHELVEFDIESVSDVVASNVTAVSGSYVLTEDGKVSSMIYDISSFASWRLSSLASVIGLDNIYKIESGGDGVFAYKRDNTVWFYSPSSHPVPAPASLLNGMKRVHALDNFTWIALDELGQAYTLDSGANTTTVRSIEREERIEAVACKRGGCVLVDDNAVAHFYGIAVHVTEIAVKDNDDKGTLLPHRVAGVTGVQQVATSYDRFSILYANGTVAEVELDDPFQTNASNETILREPRPVAGLESILSIATTDTFGIALRDDGTVWRWVHSPKGMLPASTPPSQVAGLPRIKAISVSSFSPYYFQSGSSDSHVLALDETGHVWAFGANSNGQLGDGSLVRQDTPKRVVGLENVTEIVSYPFLSLAVTKDGHAWHWGGSSYGHGNPLRPSAVPIPVPALQDVAHLAIGRQGGWNLVDRSGQSWRWNGRELTTLGLEMAPGDIRNIGGSETITTVLYGNGELWTAGLSFNTGRDLGAPGDFALLMAVGKIASVSAASNYVVAVDVSGKVWVWGYYWSNSYVSLDIEQSLSSIFAAETQRTSIGGSKV